MSSSVTQITNRPSHDAVVDASATTPTIIYVSNSALPICRTFTPQYEALAAKHGGAAKFTQMEITSDTSDMFKFGPNQLPVLVLLSRGPWSRTLMSPSLEVLEKGVQEMLAREGK